VTTLYLVRHGEAASGWDGDLDPGLSDLGHQQAAAVADRLASLGPLPVVASPLRRTRETAAAFESVWGVDAVVDERVAEIPSPTLDLSARTAWLRTVMAGEWSTAAAELRPWCDEVVRALLGFEQDTVVVTHFIAINVAVGRAQGDDRVVCFTPANGSVTILESDHAALRVRELGASFDATKVL
jgi:broad specificity phosphatase PhoE